MQQRKELQEQAQMLGVMATRSDLSLEQQQELVITFQNNESESKVLAEQLEQCLKSLQVYDENARNFSNTTEGRPTAGYDGTMSH
jgi:hypothetical protein